MSDKKIHEVELLAKLIKTVGDEHHVSQVLDLGSGQGYLSRILAFKHGMRVLAVDMSEIQTKGAERFDQRAIKALSISGNKNNNDNDDTISVSQENLKHVTEMVTPDNVGQVLSRWTVNQEDKNNDWIVCGLHTCGDLSTSMFRLFAESNQIKWLVNVGCCYHFLSEDGPQPGFPMSDGLKKKGYQLGNSARVLACQSPSKWTDPIIGQQSFNQYFYRAVLLHTIVDKGLAKKAPPIGMIKRKKTYLQYYQTAMKRLDYGSEVITEEEAEEYYQLYKDQHVDKQIIVLWTLRVLLAPVLESLILIDRWIYLKSLVESTDSKNKGVWMWPLFDSLASPRNMCIVVSK
ncbi:methyltransferase domain-containing protein [Halteromyces radiatus]|uniref:methyltransferase domain-containing protein n=1 Tax=Halteromyces radiatus TaxID=101107 RepID=UPI002220ACA6|nr:methyltransferase domain-containing protein [Halteromyces radiatus]KAI8086070.1 methyltransferase domain-containing protein [Halteromyces radiatus]